MNGERRKCTEIKAVCSCDVGSNVTVSLKDVLVPVSPALLKPEFVRSSRVTATPKTPETPTTPTRTLSRLRKKYVSAETPNSARRSRLSKETARVSIRLESIDEDLENRIPRCKTPASVKRKNSQTDSDDVFVPEKNVRTPVRRNLGFGTPKTSNKDENSSNIRKSLRKSNRIITPSTKTESNETRTPRTPKTSQRDLPKTPVSTKKTDKKTPSKPRISRTPISSRKTPNKFLILRTPLSLNNLNDTPRSMGKYSLRADVKKVIHYGEVSSTQGFSNYESDLSEIEELQDSETEYEGSQTADEDTETEGGSECDDQVPVKRRKVLTAETPVKRTLFAGDKVERKIVRSLANSDNYFLGKCSSKTSKNTISSVRVPDFGEKQIRNILSKEYAKHETLTKRYTDDFDKWQFYLNQGYNLLLHGLGSKMELLERFKKERLEGCEVVTVHGFFTGLKIDQILSIILKDILQVEDCPRNVNTAIAVIEEEIEHFETPILLVIHNIDGISLRGHKIQAVLSKLASLNKIRIVASIDHVNAALQWGNNKLSLFNFLWLATPTYCPYVEETNYENSMQIDQLGVNAELSSLNTAFSTVEAKTAEIFRLVVKDHLENRSNKQYKGILVTKLSSLCRQTFVSSNLALKTHLSKLVSFNLVKIKHNYVDIPINQHILKKFYNQHFKDKHD